MKTRERSMARAVAFVAVSAIMVWVLAGAALAGVGVQSGSLAGQAPALAQLADPGEGPGEGEEPSDNITPEPPDETAPVITGVASSDVTASSAIITWTTDEEATSEVQYGLASNYGSGTMVDEALSLGHRVMLSGLVYGTTYHYRVRSADAAGNLAMSGDYTFTTIDNVPPVISRLRVVEVTTTSATVAWTTDEKSDSRVDYGLSRYYGLSTAPDAVLVTSHSVTVTGLLPGTWYNCRAASADASGNLALSLDCEFLTPDDTPPVVSGVIVTAITSSGATVRWESDKRTHGQVEYGLTANYGARESADDSLAPNHEIMLTGLAAGTTYHYRVRSIDYWGNQSVSPDATFATTDITAPVIRDVMATGITADSATIVWLTDSAAEGIVEYGPRPSYGSASALNTSRVTRHSITLTGLEPGTTYHYKVKSRDASGLWSSSTGRAFTTGGGDGAAGDEADAGPVVRSMTASDVTSSGATIYWSTSRPATARVEYGPDERYGLWCVADGGLNTSHFALLTDLKPGTTYHYRVISRDADGYEMVSGDSTFITGIGRAPLPSLPGWAWTIIGVSGALAVGVMLVRDR